MALIWVRTGNGGADPAYLIQDLGFTVPTGAGWTALSAGSNRDPVTAIGGQFSSRELRDSDDLYTALTTGALEFSVDGSTQETATVYVADLPLLNDFTDDHFNLTDGYLTLPTRTAGWVPTRAGDLFYDSDDGYLVFYDGYESKYVQLTEGDNLTAHDQLSGLLDDDHTQYLLLSGNRARNQITGTVDISDGYLTLPRYADPASSVPSPEAGEIAYDSDDGYVVFYDGVDWIRLTDSTYSIDHGTLSGLLDDDHSQYPLMVGNAARNSITGTFDFGDGYLITPTYPVAPSVNLVDGEIVYISGVMYAYDATRSKWLSIDRQSIIAAKSANAKDVYLRVSDGIASSQTGVRALRDGTIVGMTVLTDGAATWTFEVRRNDVLAPIATLAVVAASGATSTSTNVNFAAGDELQFFANTSGINITAPIVYVEIAWRA